MFFKLLLFLVISSVLCACGGGVSEGPVRSALISCPEGEGPSQDEKDQLFSAIENSSKYPNADVRQEALKKYKYMLGVQERTCPARARQYIESVISIH